MNTWTRNSLPVTALLLLVTPTLAQAHWPPGAGVLHGFAHFGGGFGAIALVFGTGLLLGAVAWMRRTRA